MIIKTFKTLLAGTLVGFGLLVSSQANAITYDLADNNLTAWAGETLARVTLTDIGSGGVSFEVEALVDGSRLREFGFNFLGSSEPASFSITGLPDNWGFTVEVATPPSMPTGTNMDGFGRFDVFVSTTGQDYWLTPLTFSTSVGTVEDYIEASIGGIPSLFSAHVTNLDDSGSGSCSASDNNVTCTAITGYAGGGSVVPVPAAVWLFGSGLLGLAGIARRRKV